MPSGTRQDRAGIVFFGWLAFVLLLRREIDKDPPAMEKIIEYKVTGGGNPQHLAEAVNQSIGEGFEPFGNVFQQGNVFLQPVVKRAPEVTPREFR